MEYNGMSDGNINISDISKCSVYISDALEYMDFV